MMGAAPVISGERITSTPVMVNSSWNASGSDTQSSALPTSRTIPFNGKKLEIVNRFARISRSNSTSNFARVDGSRATAPLTTAHPARPSLRRAGREAAGPRRLVAAGSRQHRPPRDDPAEQPHRQYRAADRIERRAPPVGASDQHLQPVDPRALNLFTDLSHVDNKRWFDDDPRVCGSGVSALPLVVVPSNAVRCQLHRGSKNRRRFDPVTPQRERGSRAVTMAVDRAERDLCKIGLRMLGYCSLLPVDTGDRPLSVHEIADATSRRNAVDQNRCIFDSGSPV